MTPIRFVTGNKHKSGHVSHYLAQAGIEMIPCHHQSQELQTEHLDQLIHDKVLQAFELLGRPVFVEYTALYMNAIDNFPAGLTHILWEKLQLDNFARVLGNLGDSGVRARSMIGYCDSRNIFTFEGSLQGNILSEPQGERTNSWDCIFIPEGQNQPLSQLVDFQGARQQALKKLCNFLHGR
ncbi:non-canonical purine NTP pyrophosphatase [Dongshaea marina]|uniref:non-canonical purine NTP pyrophosphatase n=1 Tax=Dongshaea marina TaxID=2047966 RepID=UPI000D3E90BA|nr:non-canonical purine NTP pyrophosphatase [Dongshaea marina]